MEQSVRIIGHGIDVTSIGDIKKNLESSNMKWADKVYTTEERLQADPAPQHYRYFASRFAGKEAVAKALGTGFTEDVRWERIEILRHESGAPFVRVTGAVLAAAKVLGVNSWLISISYAGDIAMVSVIAVHE